MRFMQAHVHFRSRRRPVTDSRSSCCPRAHAHGQFSLRQSDPIRPIPTKSDQIRVNPTKKNYFFLGGRSPGVFRRCAPCTILQHLAPFFGFLRLFARRISYANLIRHRSTAFDHSLGLSTVDPRPSTVCHLPFAIRHFRTLNPQPSTLNSPSVSRPLSHSCPIPGHRPRLTAAPSHLR